MGSPLLGVEGIQGSFREGMFKGQSLAHPQAPQPMVQIETSDQGRPKPVGRDPGPAIHRGPIWVGVCNLCTR